MAISSAAKTLLLTQLPFLVNCHLKLNNPVPYSKSTLQLDPLRNVAPGSDQSDFPCQSKRIGGADPWIVDQENELVAGEPQTMTFDGSASHGGGSCQLSVTLDRQPTADSTFKTIASWIGGCPIDDTDGGTHPWNYTIPSEVPNGKATLAWSWVSKLSGQPEFYMNCAPITVSGGAEDTKEFDQLEDMFRVNLPSSECGSQLSSNLEIPNPGRYVTTIDTRALAPPTGTGCAALGQASQTPQALPAPSPHPTQTAPPAPKTALCSATAPPSTASATSTATTNNITCSPDGSLVCNGASQFGICNFGAVVWRDVAPGTTCSDGQIMRKRHLGRHTRRELGHGHGHGPRRW
ncbi:hypothetical protein M436DRAFT_49674 [Aureobasidium namibiae CBS 147.97]|uniref:Lytic polysaccharide monooxygenase n=1 Tax=Aureobasidium namibiae CBS 147.97 TaxID=1043004 RepID=A0A074WFT9_9PEZI|nr:uncharacterized protein M436DRAFT_49674 [Aureobasidium namibiae CBS 147.97]KEQ71955.1 hypothetical protein M436DRAFT_49674 [Aureobasidium namibiae CBS 147.97]